MKDLLIVLAIIALGTVLILGIVLYFIELTV